MAGIFLQAEWRKLAMANYVVDPKILQPFVPPGTELDLWQDNCYVSLVAFQFLNTRIRGFRIPFHINFNEVNLRFYVRRETKAGWQRGVVFIKEIVDRFAITLVANTLYDEHYETMPLKHQHIQTNEHFDITHYWKKKKWHSFQVIANSTPQALPANSEAEFITEHFWGYAASHRGITTEYGVEHPRWAIYDVTSYKIDVDFTQVYGESFSILNTLQPKSVFLAEGSEVIVRKGKKL